MTCIVGRWVMPSRRTWGPWDDELQRQFHRDWFDPEQVEIVLIDGRPVGMIQADSTALDTFYISRIEVDPDLQNHGVGTALMQHLVERARQSGAQAVELHVLELNRARELYERLGFRVVAKEPQNSGCVSRCPDSTPSLCGGRVGGVDVIADESTRCVVHGTGPAFVHGIPYARAASAYGSGAQSRSWPSSTAPIRAREDSAGWVRSCGRICALTRDTALPCWSRSGLGR